MKRLCKEVMKGGACAMKVAAPMMGHNATRGGKHKSTPPSVAKKTAHLIEAEGKDPKQAYAMAWSMKRAGRLTKEGGYRRKGR